MKNPEFSNERDFLDLKIMKHFGLKKYSLLSLIVPFNLFSQKYRLSQWMFGLYLWYLKLPTFACRDCKPDLGIQDLFSLLYFLLHSPILLSILTQGCNTKIMHSPWIFRSGLKIVPHGFSKRIILSFRRSSLLLFHQVPRLQI